MNTIVINDNNLSDKDIQRHSNKVRAILLSGDKLLVAHYGGVLLLPGGSIDNGENPDTAIIRELKEEAGIVYDLNELQQLLTIKHYQLNFPTRDNKIVNRLMTTYYYLGEYKGIDLNNANRTEREIIDNFRLQLMGVDDLLKGEISDNPRREYFDRENEEVVKVLKMIQRR